MNEAQLKAYILAQAENGSRIYGTGVCGRIYGPYAKQVRQNIMQALTGAKVPHSKCGATAVRNALFARFHVPSDCLAGMEDTLQMILEGTLEYETRVRAYEDQGMTRSDAQGVVDAEDMQRAPSEVSA